MNRMVTKGYQKGVYERVTKGIGTRYRCGHVRGRRRTQIYGQIFATNFVLTSNRNYAIVAYLCCRALGSPKEGCMDRKWKRAAICLLTAISLIGSSRLLAQSDDFDPGLAGATCGSGCVATYHNDNFRSGVFPHEIHLTPAILTGGTFGLKKYISVFDSRIYAQPLFVSGLAAGPVAGCSSATTQIVIVATLNNTVYAVDVTPHSASLWRICWQINVNNNNGERHPLQ